MTNNVLFRWTYCCHSATADSGKEEEVNKEDRGKREPGALLYSAYS